MNRVQLLAFLMTFSALLSCADSSRAQAAKDNDHTLQAMRDEMARSKTRLALKIPGMTESQKPYFIEYKLLDLDVREIVAEFGALVSSTETRNRFMNVGAR